MAQSLELGIRLTADARGLRAALAEAGDDLNKLGQGAGEARGSLTAFGGATDAAGAGSRRLAGEVGAAETALGALKGAAAGMAGAFGLNELIKTSDTLTTIHGRLNMVADSQAALNVVQVQSLNLANQTRTGWEAAASFLSNTTLTMREFGRSQAEATKFSKIVLQLSAIGTSAESARAALYQFGQGLASNRFGGEELRSVLEQTPELARVLASKLGVTIGQLRDMGAEGKLTARAILDALLAAEAEAEAKFAKMPVSVGQALNQLKNNALSAFDEIDQRLGLSRNAATGIQGMANNLDSLGTAFDIAGAAGAAWVAKGLAPLGPKLMQAKAALDEMRLAGAASAVTAARLAEAEQVSSAQALVSARAEQQRAAATVRAAEADFAAAAAASAKARADADAAGRTLLQATAKRSLLTDIYALNGALAAERQATAAVTATSEAASAAAGRKTAVAAALKTAQAAEQQAALGAAAANQALTNAALGAAAAKQALAQSSGLAAGALAKARDMAGAALAVVGGPWGAALMAAGAATYYLATAESEGERATRLHAEAMRGFNGALDLTTGKVEGMTESVAALRRQQLEAAADALRQSAQQQEIYARAGSFKIDRAVFDAGLPRAEAESLFAPLRALQAEFLKGQRSAEALFTEVDKLAQQDQRLKGVAQGMAEWATPLLDAQNKLRQTEAALAALAGTASAAQSELLGVAGATKQIGAMPMNGEDVKHLEHLLDKINPAEKLSKEAAKARTLMMQALEAKRMTFSEYEKNTADLDKWLEAQEEALDKKVNKKSGAERKAERKAESRDESAVKFVSEQQAKAQGLRAVAAAYEVSAAAVAAAETAERAELEVAKHQGVRRKEIIAAVKEEEAARRAVDIAKYISGLTQEAGAARRVADATAAGGAALREANVEIRLAAALSQLKIEAGGKEAQVIERTLRAQDDANQAARQAQALRHDQSALEVAERELALVNATAETRDRELALLKLRQELSEQYVGRTLEEEYRKRAAIVENTASVKARAESEKSAQEERKRVSNQATDDIVKYAADAITSSQHKTWGDIARDMRAIIKRTIAGLATELVLRPLVAPVIGAAISAAPALVRSAVGQSGGGAVGSSATQGLSMISGAKSAYDIVTGGYNSAISAVDGFGYTYLGLGAGNSLATTGAYMTVPGSTSIQAIPAAFPETFAGSAGSIGTTATLGSKPNQRLDFL